MMQRETKHHGKQQNLKDIPTRKRTNDAARNNIHDESNQALLGRLIGIDRNCFGIQRGRIDVHTRARLDNVHNHQANNQGNGTHHFKVKQSNCAGTANSLHAFHTSNPSYHRTENNWGNNHFDQFNESVAQRFHLCAEVRVEMA